jgi:hypothetical protein
MPRRSLVSAFAVAAALVVAAGGCHSRETSIRSASSAPVFDACLRGPWTVTRGVVNELVDGRVVTFTNDGGARWRFNSNGTGEFDFGLGTTYAASRNGKRITFEYKGPVIFSFTATSIDHVLRLDNLRTNAGSGALLSIDGTSVWVSLDYSRRSYTYDCAGNSLELINDVSTLKLRRP